jgi:hypothetical protein
MIAALETNRLVLRPVQLADAEQTQFLLPQWEMVKFMGARIPWPYPADGAFTYYRDVAIPWNGTRERMALDVALAASP